MANTWTTSIDNLVQFNLNKLDSNKPPTSWSDNSSSQGGEPYAALPSFHTETNENNENWRWPYRFTSRPRGEDSDDGKTIEMLREQEKRKACIERMTREITSVMQDYKSWIDPNGKEYPVDDHINWIFEHLGLLQKKGINIYNLPTSKKFLNEETRDEYLDTLQNIYTNMLSVGWVRITSDERNVQFNIQVNNLRAIPSFVDDFLSQVYDHNDDRTVALEDGKGTYVLVTDPFPSIQRAVNRELSHPNKISNKKIASSNVFMLETDSGLQTKALKDPSPEQAISLFNSTRGEVHQLRWFIPIDGHLYMWDAYDLTHWDAIAQIGIRATRLAEDMNTGVARTEYEAEIIAEEFKEYGFVNMSKQAGTYSASVPDYQGEQYYNEQHMDNGGETAYTNWDAIGNGVWDFNQNTNDFPQQKDMQPQTVFLDVMEKAFDRRLPSGIPWYSVEYANSLPLTNDFEVSNLD